MTIWDSGGTQLFAQTIPSGTGTTLTDGFRYVSPATQPILPAGSYTIGGFYSVGSDNLALLASAITTTSGVTYDCSRGGLGFAFPAGDAGTAANSYFGPNFQFTTPTSVPNTGTTFSS